MPKSKGKIPISAAKEIAEKYGVDSVIIFGVSRGGKAGQFHLTTYGTTKALCKLAAALSDQIAEKVLQSEILPPAKEPRKGGEPISEERGR